MARGGPDQQAADLAARRGVDLVADPFEQRRDRAFEELEADVPGEAVADDDVAGTFNVQKGDALYGRYWGAFRTLRHLHFNVCYYAAIEHCITAGLARFEPGAGGDYKYLRGFDAQPTYSMHFLAEPRLRDAVGRFLAQERERTISGIEWLREHSALKAE